MDAVIFRKSGDLHGRQRSTPGIDNIGIEWMPTLFQHLDGTGRVFSSTYRNQTAAVRSSRICHIFFRLRSEDIGNLLDISRRLADQIHKGIRISFNAVGVEKFSQSLIIKLFPPGDLSIIDDTCLNHYFRRAGDLPVADKLHHSQREDCAKQSRIF